MITHTTVGPLSRDISLLDVAKTMVMSNSNYVILEGSPIKLLDSVQVLRAISASQSVVDLADVLSSEAEQWSYEVPIVDNDEEARKEMVIRDLDAVILKGGNIVSSLYLLGKFMRSLPELTAKEVLDSRATVIDPMTTISEAVVKSLIFNLNGYLFVGQKRIMGYVTPLKFLEYFTREETLSMVNSGDPRALEEAVGDIIDSSDVYYFQDVKLRELATQMMNKQMEVLPIVNKSKKMIGIVKARTLLGYTL